MSNEQADKYGSRQLTELENLRAERDAYKQQAEFSAGEIKRLQLNAGIFEDVKAARDNAERDANALRAQLSMRSSIEPTTFDLKDTLHKVVNNLLEHGGEHYKRMFGRSGSCIFTNAEVGAIREVVFRALKAKLSATASIRVPRDQLIEWALWLKGRREVAGQVSMDSIETAILDLLNARDSRE